jgi:hypothetical protein
MFTQLFGVSAPNIIVFQYNPETLRHTWTQPQSAATEANPLAVKGLPGESFSFTLAMDVTDQIAEGNAVAQLDAETNGIYARIAALEKLLFPVPSNPAGGKRAVPASQVPAVLFVWGAGRVVPVRVTSLTFTEKLFDASLNPTHAEAVIELKVLTKKELDAVSGPLKQVTQAAYDYTNARRDVLAALNLNNASDSFEMPPLPGL